MKRLIVVIAASVFTLQSYAQTVTIGTQVWMTKNLDVSTFRNGDPIPQAKTNEEWKKAGENKQPAWCYYDNDPANGAKYGKLYNWYAADDPRGLAPEGFHIPIPKNWDSLILFIARLYSGNVGISMKNTSGWLSWKNHGEETKTCDNCENWSDKYKEKVPCHKCKDTRSVRVKVPIISHPANGNNKSGFTGLPAGTRGEYGFVRRGEMAVWWTSTISETRGKAISVSLMPNHEILIISNDELLMGASVRCLK